jgi:hypothetical protein
VQPALPIICDAVVLHCHHSVVAEKALFCFKSYLGRCGAGECVRALPVVLPSIVAALKDHRHKAGVVRQALNCVVNLGAVPDNRVPILAAATGVRKGIKLHAVTRAKRV